MGRWNHVRGAAACRAIPSTDPTAAPLHLLPRHVHPNGHGRPPRCRALQMPVMHVLLEAAPSIIEPSEAAARRTRSSSSTPRRAPCAAAARLLPSRADRVPTGSMAATDVQGRRTPHHHAAVRRPACTRKRSRRRWWRQRAARVSASAMRRSFDATSPSRPARAVHAVSAESHVPLDTTIDHRRPALGTLRARLARVTVAAAHGAATARDERRGGASVDVQRQQLASAIANRRRLEGQLDSGRRPRRWHRMRRRRAPLPWRRRRRRRRRRRWQQQVGAGPAVRERGAPVTHPYPAVRAR